MKMDAYKFIEKLAKKLEAARDLPVASQFKSKDVPVKEPRQ